MEYKKQKTGTGEQSCIVQPNPNRMYLQLLIILLSQNLTGRVKYKHVLNTVHFMTMVVLYCTVRTNK